MRWAFTFHVFLPDNMIKQLGVVGVHPSTARTRHHLLLSVAAQVLSQLRTPFSGGFTIWGFHRMEDLQIRQTVCCAACTCLKYNVCVLKDYYCLCRICQIKNLYISLNIHL